MSKLEEVSYEKLVFLHPRVLSRVAGFPVASPCLCGKLQNLSFSKVSKEVVMSFCVAGVALCDIPTCLITCGKCQNWRKSRTKCSFFCLVSSLWFSCGVAVSMGEAGKLYLFECFQAGCHTLHTLHFTLLTPHFTLDTPLHSSHHTPHFTLYTFHFTILTLHSALHTPHFPLHAPHSTLYTPHFTVHTLQSWVVES